jgi:hypothetical protein
VERIIRILVVIPIALFALFLTQVIFEIIREIGKTVCSPGILEFAPLMNSTGEIAYVGFIIGTAFLAAIPSQSAARRLSPLDNNILEVITAFVCAGLVVLLMIPTLNTTAAPSYIKFIGVLCFIIPPFVVAGILRNSSKTKGDISRTLTFYTLASVGLTVASVILNRLAWYISESGLILSWLYDMFFTYEC